MRPGMNLYDVLVVVHSLSKFGIPLNYVQNNTVNKELHSPTIKHFPPRHSATGPRHSEHTNPPALLFAIDEQQCS